MDCFKESVSVASLKDITLSLSEEWGRGSCLCLLSTMERCCPLDVSDLSDLLVQLELSSLTFL